MISLLREESIMKLTPPKCGCGHYASKPTKNFAKENSIIWMCSQGHATSITYCSESDIKLVKELLK